MDILKSCFLPKLNTKALKVLAYFKMIHYADSDQLLCELLYVYMEIEHNRNGAMSSAVSTHVEYIPDSRGY